MQRLYRHVTWRGRAKCNDCAATWRSQCSSAAVMYEPTIQAVYFGRCEAGPWRLQNPACPSPPSALLLGRLHKRILEGPQ